MHRSDSCNVLQLAPRLRLPRARQRFEKAIAARGSCFFPMGRWTAAVAGLACVLAGCRGGPLEAERLQAWVQRPWGAGRGGVSTEELRDAVAVEVEFVPAPKPLAKEVLMRTGPPCPIE